MLSLVVNSRILQRALRTKRPKTYGIIRGKTREALILNAYKDDKHSSEGFPVHFDVELLLVLRANSVCAG